MTFPQKNVGLETCTLLTSCVILNKLLNFSEPQFPYLYNGNNNKTYLMRLLKRLNYIWKALSMAPGTYSVFKSWSKHSGPWDYWRVPGKGRRCTWLGYRGHPATHCPVIQGESVYHLNPQLPHLHIE